MYLQRTLPYNLDLETILIEKAYICSFKNKVIYTSIQWLCISSQESVELDDE